MSRSQNVHIVNVIQTQTLDFHQSQVESHSGFNKVKLGSLFRKMKM